MYSLGDAVKNRNFSKTEMKDLPNVHKREIESIYKWNLIKELNETVDTGLPKISNKYFYYPFENFICFYSLIFGM